MTVFFLQFFTANLADLAVHCENFCFSAEHWSKCWWMSQKKQSFFGESTNTSVRSTKTKNFTVNCQICKVSCTKQQRKLSKFLKLRDVAFTGKMITSFQSKWVQIVLSEPFSGRKIFCMRQENYAVRHLMFSSVFLAFLVVSLLFSQWTLMLNPEILSFSGERRTKFEWTRKTQDFRVKHQGELRKL